MDSPKQADLLANLKLLHPAVELLQATDPDKLTPRDAMDLIYKLSQLV
jgi:hypothetical protein